MKTTTDKTKARRFPNLLAARDHAAPLGVYPSRCAIPIPDGDLRGEWGVCLKPGEGLWLAEETQEVEPDEEPDV